jgi:VanZ family protein
MRLVEQSRRLLRIAAWTLVAAGFVVAAVPLGDRPTTAMPHHLEHIAFFLAIGACLAGGYPHRRRLVAVLVTCLPGAIQLVQVWAPDRHPRLSDAAVGIAGAWLGVVVMAGLERLLPPQAAAAARDRRVGPP